MTFDTYIGMDYSGAETAESRLKGLQVYTATDGEPRRVHASGEPDQAHWNWSRRQIAEWLIEQAQGGTRFIAGIDHAFSFPWSYMQRYRLASWDEFLADFVEHWPTHEPHTYVDFIRDRRPPRTGRANELRLCERWTGSAKSVFQFDCPGQVAKSTHAGVPWLWHIRNEIGNRVHFWPFDGWQVSPDKCLIVEVYPSVFRNRHPRQDAPAMSTTPTRWHAGSKRPASEASWKGTWLRHSARRSEKLPNSRVGYLGLPEVERG